jgi:DNA-directed RNA polymerase subunit F
MDPQVVESNPVTWSEVKNDLKRIKKRDGELSFRGNKTEEHLNSLHIIPETSAKELFSKIEKLNILRMKPQHIVKIIDLMPSSEAEIKYLFTSMSLTVSKDQTANLFKIIKSYLPEKK